MADKYPFKLRFNKKAIREWAKRYLVEYDADIENLIAPQVKARGYFLQEEFLRLCRWKTPRSERKVASNSADYVEAVTQTTLSTPNERLCIEVLLLLNGVRWPTASVVLHFCHAAPPILRTPSPNTTLKQCMRIEDLPVGFGEGWVGVGSREDGQRCDLVQGRIVSFEGAAK